MIICIFLFISVLYVLFITILDSLHKVAGFFNKNKAGLVFGNSQPFFLKIQVIIQVIIIKLAYGLVNTLTNVKILYLLYLVSALFWFIPITASMTGALVPATDIDAQLAEANQNQADAETQNTDAQLGTEAPDTKSGTDSDPKAIRIDLTDKGLVDSFVVHEKSASERLIVALDRQGTCLWHIALPISPDADLDGEDPVVKVYNFETHDPWASIIKKRKYLPKGLKLEASLFRSGTFWLVGGVPVYKVEIPSDAEQTVGFKLICLQGEGEDPDDQFEIYPTYTSLYHLIEDEPLYRCPYGVSFLVDNRCWCDEYWTAKPKAASLGMLPDWDPAQFLATLATLG